MHPPPRVAPSPVKQPLKDGMKNEDDVETPIGDGNSALVLFYSERCGHSVNMMPAWEEMKKSMGSSGQFDIISLEQSKNPQEVHQHSIRGFPTIRFYPDGFPSPNFVEYKGPRTSESFIKFAQSGGQEV